MNLNLSLNQSRESQRLSVKKGETRPLRPQQQVSGWMVKILDGIPVDPLVKKKGTKISEGIFWAGGRS